MLMNRDFVKIHHARDKKYIQIEKQSIQMLQSEGIYPTKFDFSLTLQFELTSHCNVKCKHCYNNSGTENNIQDRMSPEQWLNFAKYLVSKGGIFQCVISGGEPLLLGDSLYDIMDVLHEDGTDFLVISNCYLMTEEKAKRFSEYRFKWFQVSIDGANEAFHDDFRQRKGSWQRAVNGALLISKYGIPLTIAHSVTPGNLQEVKEMCKLAYELGAGSIILGEVTPSGRSATNYDLLLSREQKNHLYEMIEEVSALYQGKMRVERSSSAKNQLLRYTNTPNSGAIIRPNGDVRLDCMAPFVIGNILESDFDTIWKTKAADCWENPKVKAYIEGYSEDCDINSKYKNYYDTDILI